MVRLSGGFGSKPMLINYRTFLRKLQSVRLRKPKPRGAVANT